MEMPWKATNFFLWLLLINICTGFPINLDVSQEAFHSQFLAGSIGVLLTVCGVVCLVGCLCCQRHHGFKEFHNAPVLASSSSSLDHGLTNPINNGEFTIFTPLSSSQQTNIFLAHEQIVQHDINSNEAGVDIHSWFDDTQIDFPRTKLKYIREYGKGWFGRVVEGTAQGITGDEQTWTPVVVRILESTATNAERAVFLHDARIYRLSIHPHILQLLGRNLQSIPLLLLQEICSKGDLKKYLLENQKTPAKILNSELPLRWCCQLSSAMKHLHENNLTHPDLSTRNCQITSDLSLKLGDYGIAASLYPDDYYQGVPAVPVRWCAPESLTYTSTTIQPKEITCESNVWSLGVTMWEIFECGAQPYSHLSDDEVISHVLSSATVRLSVPRFTLLYTNYIYRLMQLCWASYELRPPVTQVQLMLSDLMQVYQNTKDLASNEPLISMQDFDKRWNTFKSNSITRTDNHQFYLDENKSEMDIDINDISVLNLKLDKDMKEMSPSLNNLHGSLDNLTGSEMDSWLQNLATKTGDILYVRGLSEAFNDLDNTLAMENVSSSDSSYLPSPAPETFSNVVNKLEFKLGPTENHLNFVNELDKTQHSSLTESTQRTSSESETEDETWRRKVEQGAYSEKVHQKSKSVTDLMILTHIDQSESESETPLPSLDYRINYKNVRYAPMQNLESVSLMYGSEGNLLSVHDKFQEELKRLQEERKDSLLFVPESSISDYKSDELSDTPCTTIAPCNLEEQTSYSVNTSPAHRNPESLIEELSSPRKIQPESQIYNIFNVSVDSRFRPHLDNIVFESTEPNCREESPRHYEVPRLVDIIQNNDSLMDYIIARYESQTDFQSSANEVQTMPKHQVCFDLSLTQDKLLPSSMTHSAICSNNTYALGEDLEFSSDFGNYIQHVDECEDKPTELDLTYSLETWNNFLGDTLNEPREYCNDFASFPSESQASLKECELNSIDASGFTQIESIVDSDHPICTNFTQPVYNRMPDLIPTTHREDGIKINNWEPEEGWFLHPQSNSEVSGQLDTTQTEEDDIESYERYNRDNDVMAAIRNELLLKLPQAQGHSSESVRDYEECDTEERNEIHIKYNVYTTPLSPIPEESYSESDACFYICNKDDSTDTESDDEWPAPFEEENNTYVTNLETQSIHNVDSLDQVNQNPHTPSQDSCCSNDTLFNLEELTCGVNEIENLKEKSGCEADKILKDNGEEIKTDYFVIEKFQKEFNEDINTVIKNIYEIQILFAETMANSIIINHLNEHVSFKSSEPFLVSNYNDSNVHDKNTDAILDINTLELATSKNEANLLEAENQITCHLDLVTNENENFITKSCNCSRNICNPLYCTYLKNGDRQMNEEISRCLSERSRINGIKPTGFEQNHQSDTSLTNKYMLYKEANRSDINQNDKTTFDWELTNKTIGGSHHMYIIVNDKNSYNFYDNLDSKSLTENGAGCKDLDDNIMQDNSDTVTTLNLKNIENTIDIKDNPQNHITDINSSHSANNIGNLNYITEFLDYERKNIDSGCKTSLIADNNYSNINDIKINMIGNLQPQYANIVHEEHLYDVVEHDIYDVLTDIRFSGPGDIQLMSTSFSESVDVDEQDWDSGSDTRSSSSGEFIWKEGEHEESVKALRAAPQNENILERAEPLDDIKEINSESSDEDDDDEDLDSPEFIPSAWDKYATPSKSALRSPEKTLERSTVKQTKPKGVWFKKQKYHCVYEYPKEPESPVINHYELWQPISKSVLDWEVDTSPYIPHYERSNYGEYDINTRKTDDFYHTNKSSTEFSATDDDFYISSTARPFEAYSSLSQFFPGASEQWVDLTKSNDNVTPDSGIEDAMSSLSDVSHHYKVPSLKTLAAMALKQNHVNVIKNNNVTLGGLRHARNKLKLDLPPSPSAFSYTKVFTLEPPEEPITRCEIPTFTTFGKSRFVVQQVDTLSNSDKDGCKNVSFEALPYKPLKTDKSKVEVVRGEASLLDSADEDSGIESSTFERRSVEN